MTTASSSLVWTTAKSSTLAALAEHSAGYAPYCNLNVVDLWAYRVHPVRWAQVGDTVLYGLSDYMTDERYYTALGRRSAREAITQLARWLGGDDLTLKCVPEETVDALDGWDAIAAYEEDADNHDYVLDAGDLVELRAKPLRRKHQSLMRRHPNLVVRELDRSNPRDRARIYELFRQWVAQTGATEWDKEFLALRRALHIPGQHLVCLGVFDGPRLIAYSVNGPATDGYYQGFFGKVDRRYPGLGVHLEHVTATHMSEHYGARLLNLQPDSGIAGLRRYKQSLGPCAMLKKYTVRVSADRL